MVPSINEIEIIHNCRWDSFLIALQEKANSKFKAENSVQDPYEPVQKLVEEYLEDCSEKHILDIGCEIGKNAIPFLKHGHTVSLLDICPKALAYTIENIRKRNLYDGVVDCIQARVKDLPKDIGPFDAVIGTYAFSFIPPDIFEEVMQENVLGNVKEGGYFAGGFFGKEHAWAVDPNLSLPTEESISNLFESMDFTILELTEVLEEGKETVRKGPVSFHEFQVIARRNST